MRTALTTIFTIISILMFSQNKVNVELNKLFQNLDVNQNINLMIKNSDLKFEFGVNNGVNWTGGNTKIYSAKIKENKLIKSAIVNGQILISQNEHQEKNNAFEINERFVFNNEDDLIFEFNRLFSLFENHAFKIKESETQQTETYNTISQSKKLLFNDNGQISELTFAYLLPNKQKKDYSLVIVFKNKIEI